MNLPFFNNLSPGVNACKQLSHVSSALTLSMEGGFRPVEVTLSRSVAEALVHVIFNDSCSLSLS